MFGHIILFIVLLLFPDRDVVHAAIKQQEIIYPQTLTDSTKIDSHSFEPPFSGIDNSGLRMIGKGWRVSGSTSIKNNFGRLTPDQQVTGLCYMFYIHEFVLHVLYIIIIEVFNVVSYPVILW